MKDVTIVMPATDRRLAVVKKLAAARRQCNEEGSSFREWVAGNTPYKHSTAIKYARIGDKALPLERLMTSRTHAQKANRKMRAKKRVAESLGSLSGCKAMYARLNRGDQAAFRSWLNKREETEK